LVELPDPAPRPNWVLVQVKAFGVNRSELYTRLGYSGQAVPLPRVPGIECVGEVLNGGGTDLPTGQVVAAAMGQMGRQYDGGYAELALLPRRAVFPLHTQLEWTRLAALLEMYLTACGALYDALQLSYGQTLLIRGGSSSVGMACTSLAQKMGCQVYTTTRRSYKFPDLRQAGATAVIQDYGSVREELLKLAPEGVDAVIDLIGLPATLQESLQCCRPGGTACLLGFLGNDWSYDFFP